MKDWLKDVLKHIKEDLAKAHKSWTLVLNSVSGALVGAWLYLLSNPDALTQALAFLPQLEGFLSPKTLTAITLGINFLNFVLRFKTNSRVADK
jgi:hypothetical protein